MQKNALITMKIEQDGSYLSGLLFKNIQRHG